MARRHAFDREPGCQFDDLKKEVYAQERARGGTASAAAETASVAYATAMRWEAHPDMQARIRELREGSNKFLVGVSKVWIMQELRKNVEEGRAAGEFKASNEALELMYKILCTDKDLLPNTPSAESGDMTDAELERQLREKFQPRTSTNLLVETTGEVTLRNELPAEPEYAEAAS